MSLTAEGIRADNRREKSKHTMNVSSRQGMKGINKDINNCFHFTCL